MRRRADRTLISVRTEGGLLPYEFLERLAALDADVKGLDSESYHLYPHESLGDGANRAWSRLLGAWRAFRDALGKLPENDTATRLTRERWLLPLFQELGYGRLPAAKAREIGRRSYAVSHVWENRSPVHLLGCRVPLGIRSAGVAGAAKASPHGLVQELLNRSDEFLWGFLSNGLVLRLLRDNHSLTRQAFVEFDLEAIFEGEQFSEFFVLWLVCHQSRVEADKPDDVWLERWFQRTRKEGVRALDHLREGVEDAIKALGRGFLRRRGNERLHAALESGELDTQDYYRQLLRLVYRLIFLFVAESRGVLLDPNATADAHERYEQFYAASRLRALSLRRRAGDFVDLWRALRLVMDKLDEGCPELALPALDSFLWRDEAVSWLIDADLGNDDLLAAIYHLCHVTERGVRLPVSWQSIGSEELGSVYESLLELHPKIHRDTAQFSLEVAAGHERKTTGSYYTPASLVDCLLDSALEPVLDEAASRDDAADAILALEVCDPACGSGHFLVAAARRIAKRLASARSGDDEPSPEELQKALRDVVGHCIYGVDLNPMAVELCKVSLWMEALEPGRPLSFLDSHILPGNSLLGTTPALLKKGIPDDAFKPIEGDDAAFCRDLRKLNAQDRTGQQRLFAPEEAPFRRLGDLATGIRQLEGIDDATVAGVRQKEARWLAIRDSSDYLFGRMWADAWCAAFVQLKVESDERPFPIVHRKFKEIEENPWNANASLREEIRRLADQYQFFHWHLAFPDVFRVPEDLKTAENQDAGWTGGFDVVLGNPPWDRLKLQEKEFFALHDPEIAAAPKAADRRRRIARLEEKDPGLFALFLEARRFSEGKSHLVRDSGRYPLCGRGDVNTYSVFAELNRSLISFRGRVGCIVPTGIATDDTTKLFFQDVMENGALHSLYDFQSGPGLFAEVGHARFKFCLLTMLGSRGNKGRAADFAFFLRKATHLADADRRFSLSASDIALLNPNTRTCPIFRSRRDAEITKRIYERVPVLIKEVQQDNIQGQGRAWSVQFKRMFHMADDSGIFRTYEQMDTELHLDGNTFKGAGDSYFPLFEAKMIHHFNWRFGDYRDQPVGSQSTALPEVPEEQLKDPHYLPLPKYWVPKSSVDDWFSGVWNNAWLVGWRDICRADDFRTTIVAIAPRVALGHTTPLILSDHSAQLTSCLVGCLSSFVFDYLARQKLGGTHLTYTVLSQLPAVSPACYEASTPISSDVILHWISARVLELTYTAWDLQHFAQDCGYDGPPFRWDAARRFLLRCELDAAFFHLYGIERDDVDYIMETFPIVKRKDVKEHGDYRTKLQILQIYDAMQRAMSTGEPYQTLLDPPPADPRVAHPPREEES